MNRKLILGAGIMALAGMVATANAASQTHPTAATGQHMQLAKGDAAPADGDQAAPAKKHKSGKRHSHGNAGARPPKNVDSAPVPATK